MERKMHGRTKGKSQVGQWVTTAPPLIEMMQSDGGNNINRTDKKELYNIR
jgi:hypothetical protein